MNHNVTALKTKVQRWAEEITAAYGDSVQAIIEVGRKLQQAKAACSRGEWGELTGETTGKPLLPFGHRTAQRLKAIADNRALSNPTHVSDLPASWGTLAVLASLAPDDIEAAIADGVIHPEMERKDAEALKAQLTGAKPKPASPAQVLDFTPAPPTPTQGQAARLAEVRVELGEKLRQISDLQQGAAERRAENAWHDRNDPHTRGLALGVSLLVGLDEMLRMVRDALYPAVLTPEQRQRARALLDQLSAILDEVQS
jgi:hypothetical protein